MDRVLSILLGVVIARDRIDHPWQEYAWRPVSVFLNAPEVGEWRELRRDARSTHYHAATLPLELHAKETIGYVANLDTGAPLVYVVLREKSGGGPPMEVAVITASPYDAEVYGYDGSEIVGGVAMPEPLVELLEAFVAEHHVEEKFVKRQRQKHHREEEHKFGQEPIEVLRQRKGQPGASDE
jgi:uncharacterized protein DUF3305